MNSNSNSVNINTPMARSIFSNLFIQHVNKHSSNTYRDLVFLCIGSDRSTGDALGPLVGYKLSKSLLSYDNIHIYGTLNEPVHAKNLENNIELIYSNHKNPFIIAIDACLGRIGRVGYISIGEGPLSPGAGVNRNLPPVGDIHIMGVVNLGGYMQYMVLQNTRLNLVMKMAEIISEGISFAMWKENKRKILS